MSKVTPTAVRVFAKTPTGKTLSINLDTNNTIEHLKQLIYRQSDTGGDLFEMNLTLAGNQLENKNTLSEYRISPDETVEVVMHESNDVVIPLVVISLHEPPLTVYVKTSYTVKQLKQLVSQLYRNAPILKLLAKGVKLYNTMMLSHYNIQRNDKIHMVINVQGGGRILLSRFLFTDISRPLDVCRPLPTDPGFRRFCNGVSSEGLCVNPNCDVYGERFVCQHGYGVYRVKEDPTKCPECQCESPRVDSFGFSLANVIVRAMPLGLTAQEAVTRCNLSETEGNYLFVPQLVLHSQYENREYEFIEVLSSTPDCPISLDWELCSVCYRMLVGSNVCNHGQTVN